MEPKRCLCGNPDDFSATLQRPTFTKFGHETYFGVPSFLLVIPPKSEIESRLNRHLTQSRLQVTGCTAERYCLLRVVVQGPGSLLHVVVQGPGSLLHVVVQGPGSLLQVVVQGPGSLLHVVVQGPGDRKSVV